MGGSALPLGSWFTALPSRGGSPLFTLIWGAGGTTEPSWYVSPPLRVGRGRWDPGSVRFFRRFFFRGLTVETSDCSTKLSDVVGLLVRRGAVELMLVRTFLCFTGLWNTWSEKELVTWRGYYGGVVVLHVLCRVCWAIPGDIRFTFTFLQHHTVKERCPKSHSVATLFLL